MPIVTNEQQSALAIRLRYLRDVAPKHIADEAETLFPGLRRLRRPDLGPLPEKMDSLQHLVELTRRGVGTP